MSPISSSVKFRVNLVLLVGVLTGNTLAHVAAIKPSITVNESKKIEMINFNNCMVSADRQCSHLLTYDRNRVLDSLSNTMNWIRYNNRLKIYNDSMAAEIAKFRYEDVY